MLTLPTKFGIKEIKIHEEYTLVYDGVERQCKIEIIEKAKGYIKVFDRTRGGYRTFTIAEIGK